MFSSTKQVQKHKRENHSNSCNYCKKCFQTEEHLKRHQNVALKPDGTFKHYCVPCEVRCCTLLDLQRHMNSHEKDPIKCEYCNNAFSTKWRLKAHKDSRKEAICSKCGKYCVMNKIWRFTSILHIIRGNVNYATKSTA